MFGVGLSYRNRQIRVLPKNKLPRNGKFGFISKMNIIFVGKMAEAKKKYSTTITKKKAESKHDIVQLVVCVIIEDADTGKYLLMNRGDLLSIMVASHMDSYEYMYLQTAKRAIATKTNIDIDHDICFDPEFVGYAYDESAFGYGSHFGIVYRVKTKKDDVSCDKDQSVKCCDWVSADMDIEGLDPWSKMIMKSYCRSKFKE